jgi:hypothetical protein
VLCKCFRIQYPLLFHLDLPLSASADMQASLLHDLSVMANVVPFLKASNILALSTSTSSLNHMSPVASLLLTVLHLNSVLCLCNFFLTLRRLCAMKSIQQHPHLDIFTSLSLPLYSATCFGLTGHQHVYELLDRRDLPLFSCISAVLFDVNLF